MEREIGETFEYEGKKLQVKECAYSGCDGCFFDEQHIPCSKNVAGYCGSMFRTDKKKVIFVEATEQQTKEPKERKIGENFEFEGHKLRVVERGRDKCDECFFYNIGCISNKYVRGFCAEDYRTDKKNVIFMEYNDEHPQEQVEPQELNLCEILKDCAKGEKFWSPLFGDVNLFYIDEEAKNIKVLTKSGFTWNINRDGTITIKGGESPEIMLYPSREQRDWSKVKYEPRKERFDPKTLKAFDKVLARDSDEYEWKIEIYSHKNNNNNYPYKCITYSYKHCIPYNDETKHLVGTTDEAPEFYRYWED